MGPYLCPAGVPPVAPGLTVPSSFPGEMQGTVHRLLLEQRQSELRAGSVLLLRQVRRAGGCLSHKQWDPIPGECGVGSYGGGDTAHHPSRSQPRHTLEL